MPETILTIKLPELTKTSKEASDALIKYFKKFVKDLMLPKHKFIIGDWVWHNLKLYQIKHRIHIEEGVTDPQYFITGNSNINTPVAESSLSKEKI